MNKPECHEPRVVIISSHALFARLLSRALAAHGLVCDRVAGNAAEGIMLCARLKPDAVLIDPKLPDEDGLEAAEQILTHAPATRIILLTAHPSPDLPDRAAGLGVSVLPQDTSLGSLFDTLRQAATGTVTACPSAPGPAAEAAGIRKPGTTPLTNRESQVLALLAEGQDARAIARKLNITINTCRGYVKSILAKLGAQTQLEAVAVARQKGLLDPTI